MRKNGRLLLVALCVLAFFLLVPALVEKTQEAESPVMDRPLVVAFFSVARLMERQTSDQISPLRIDRPEGIVTTSIQTVLGPDVKADANGHPLRESTYIRAVYEAFRLEDKSG